MRIATANTVRRLLKLATTITAAIFVSASCNTTPTPKDTRASDEAAIRAASKAWSDATQAKDLDKAMSFYADSAVQMADQGPLISDHATLRAGWQKMFSLPGPGLSFQTSGVDVAKSGDIAYEYGAYDFAVSDSSGTINDQKGKYVVIWTKQADGTWRAAVDIDNIDARPPATAPQPVAHSGSKRRKHR
jgi:ketosteroid isomerase-like protein